MVIKLSSFSTEVSGSVSSVAAPSTAAVPEFPRRMRVFCAKELPWSVWR